MIFHQSRLDRLAKLKLDNLLKKNPYLFRAKNVNTAQELIEGCLDAFLSSSEEKIFGDFLEDLVIYVSAQCYGGAKSSAEGLDLEFVKDKCRYLVSIKSGPNWGNSSQHSKLATDFSRAVRVQLQHRDVNQPVPILGICYGKSKTVFTSKSYWRYTGQAFWALLSDDEHLYIDIIEPIGYEAKRHNDDFCEGRARLINQFVRRFMEEDFCTSDGSIDWEKLVEYNSATPQ